jgi:hypothetical protein
LVNLSRDENTCIPVIPNLIGIRLSAFCGLSDCVSRAELRDAFNIFLQRFDNIRVS